jgi:ATP-dependent helicase HrpA
LQALAQQIQHAMLAERFTLRRKWQQLQQLQKQNKPTDKAFEELKERVGRSIEKAAARLNNLPVVSYPKELPVSQKKDEILDALKNNQVIVVAGETGSGKTTQLPKICLEAGLGVYGKIAHTQPRRLAARSVAARIAEELDVTLGDQVGYQVRFSDQSNDTTLVKLMTDGILLAETQRDRFLNQYDCIIIDEAHERSLNIDFLLGYLKQLLPQRPDLKVVITSATIDVTRFSKHFNDAPVIEVTGRTFPVDVWYRPLMEEGEENDGVNQSESILCAVEEIMSWEQSQTSNVQGDVLVFLSGEREIRETSEVLRRAELRHTEVLPLYARLSAADQQKIFSSHTGRRIILSTNVAETSLTVPGIRYVIDPGEARISRYSYKSKIQRLPIEAISQASANQRKGRCGRVADGICIRLYDEDDFLARPEFTDPEIRRTNLAAVILQMLQLKLGDIRDFPFLDAPDNSFIKDGYHLLQELGAVNPKGILSQEGRHLAKLPIDPRLAKMVMTAAGNNSLSEILIIVSALSSQDPRERPSDKQQAADEKHRVHKHDESDFLSYVNLWHSYEEQRQELSQNHLRKYCKKHFLNYMRMREWRDVHRQLHLVCKELKWKENSDPASYEMVHRSLLSGLLSHLGNKTDEGDYLGARNRKFHIFPGSGQFKAKPKWIMVSELVETSRLFARVCAKIDPLWVESLAKHLVKRKHFEPHWEKRRGQVMAYEQVSLYGLVIESKRRVAYAKLDPKVSREIFIMSGLVEQRINCKGSFLQKNKQLINDISALEDKSRRRDILVDDQLIAQFYADRIPQEMADTASFETWRKEAEQKDPSVLLLTKQYLMQHSAVGVTQAQFPDVWQYQGMQLPLSYHFEPGHVNDGVSLSVPAAILAQIPDAQLQWLVPGMLREKCVVLIKSLPKQKRRNFVPVPDTVEDFLERVSLYQGALVDSLGTFLSRRSGISISASDWEGSELDSHYLMNINVLDADGDLLGQGRNLSELQKRYKVDTQKGLQQAASNDIEREEIYRWDFNELPNVYESKQLGVTVKAYPGLVDKGSHVSLCLRDQEEVAISETEMGLTRLIYLSQVEQVRFLRGEVKSLDKAILWYHGLGTKADLANQVILLAIRDCFVAGQSIPRNQEDFDQRIANNKAQLASKTQYWAKWAMEVLELRYQITRALKGKVSIELAMALGDVKTQLERLIYKDFMLNTPLEWLVHYPRYLKGILWRLERIGGSVAKDRVALIEIQSWHDKSQKEPSHSGQIANLQRLRWLVEELRISHFAQQLGTIEPVSDKRLRKFCTDAEL